MDEVQNRLSSMNRSNTWNSLQNTFRGSCVPVQKRKTTKDTPSPVLRKSNPLNISITKHSRGESDSVVIADSDEENCDENQTGQPWKKKHRPATRKPLQENESDSDVIDDSNYDDVDCTHCDNIAQKQAGKVRLAFSPRKEEAQAKFTGLKANRRNSQNFERTFNSSTIDQKCLEETIVDSDDDIDEAAKKSHSQCSSKEVFIDTQSSTTSIKWKAAELPMSVAPNLQSPKRNRCKKGGLVEQLRQVVNRSKSELIFWMNERKSELRSPGERVRVLKCETSYGRVLLHCETVNGGEKIICLDPSYRKLNQLEVGKLIEIEFDSNFDYLIDGRCHVYPGAFKVLC